MGDNDEGGRESTLCKRTLRNQHIQFRRGSLHNWSTRIASSRNIARIQVHLCNQLASPLVAAGLSRLPSRQLRLLRDDEDGPFPSSDIAPSKHPKKAAEGMVRGGCLNPPTPKIRAPHNFVTMTQCIPPTQIANNLIWGMFKPVVSR